MIKIKNNNKIFIALFSTMSVPTDTHLIVQRHTFCRMVQPRYPCSARISRLVAT